jgi:hypothetical protein
MGGEQMSINDIIYGIKKKKKRLKMKKLKIRTIPFMKRESMLVTGILTKTH